MLRLNLIVTQMYNFSCSPPNTSFLLGKNVKILNRPTLRRDIIMCGWWRHLTLQWRHGSTCGRLLICNLWTYQCSIYYINSKGVSVFAQYFNTLIREIFVIKGFINQHRLGSAFSWMIILIRFYTIHWHIVLFYTPLMDYFSNWMGKVAPNASNLCQTVSLLCVWCVHGCVCATFKSHIRQQGTYRNVVKCFL